MGPRPTSSSSSDSTPAAAAEFRPYRRFVSRVILTFSTLGSAWLLSSIAVTIYRRSNAVPSGTPIGLVATATDFESCHDELRDVTHGLATHLENFQLIAHYDIDEAQRWAEDRAFWLGQWKAADERCHFAAPRPGKLAKEWEQLAAIHAELHETEASYDKELRRFGNDQAPRLARIQERLDRVGQKLATGGSEPAASPPQNASKDAGDTTP
jgi:hypothetical protein